MAMVFLALTIYLITELLSLFNMVNRLSLTLFWCLVLFIIYIQMSRKYGSIASFCGMIRGKAEAVIDSIRTNPLFASAVAIGFASVLIAVFTVPYNHDSMTYHLARVAFWEQNHSVGHYATSVIRQVSSPVFAEILCLHIYVISGHMMNLCNLVQSSAFIITACTIYRMLTDLRVNSRIAVISVLLFMTMPIAFAESVSTQNDLVVTMWFTLFVSEMIRILKRPDRLGFDRRSLTDVLSIAGLIALIYLTKPSALFGVIVCFVFSLPLLIMRKEKIGVIIGYCAIGACAALVMILPEVIRNIMTFGHVSDKSIAGNIIVGSCMPSYLFVNFLKNFTFNLPNRICPYIKDGLTAFVYGIASLLKVPVDDPSISLSGTFEYNDPLAYNFDYAINSLVEWILIAGGIALIISCIRTRKKLEGIRVFILSSGIISFLVFCTVLRWQEWGTRLMLPYLSFLCILIGIIMDEVLQRDEFVTPIILFLALTGVLNSIALQTWCAAKGRFGKEMAVFATISDDYYSYREVTDVIKKNGYQKIGIVGSEGVMEFPLFVLLDGKIEKLFHVCVENATDKYSDKEPPDCVIWIGNLPDEEVLIINGEEYGKKIQTEGMALFTQT